MKPLVDPEYEKVWDFDNTDWSTGSPTSVWSPSFRNREGDRMEKAKDRLPRDLYINEPEVKFNTCGSRGAGNDGGKSSKRVDCLERSE